MFAASCVPYGEAKMRVDPLLPPGKRTFTPEFYARAVRRMRGAAIVLIACAPPAFFLRRRIAPTLEQLIQSTGAFCADVSRQMQAAIQGERWLHWLILLGVVFVGAAAR